jgi:hypothetical protein
LQQRTGASTDSAFFHNPRVNKFFLRVVALLDEVLEDSCGGFLSTFGNTGNTRTTDPLTKAPCNGFGVDLGGKSLSDLIQPFDLQGASKHRKGFSDRSEF